MVDVSVIISTFDRLWSLPDAIESCRHSVCDTEIIVIDDGSTDGTWDWLQTQQDVISLRQRNLGKCWAVNAGFARARGEFVRFLDSDDLLLPGVNALQLAAARANDADVVTAGCTLVDENLRVIEEQPWVDCDDFVAQQLGECFPSHYSAFLYRRTFVEDVPHRQEYGLVDDTQFITEVAIKEPRVTLVDVQALRHRYHRRERIQFTHGVTESVKRWQCYQIHRAAARALQERNSFTARRRRVLATAVWRNAAAIAFMSVDEAARIAEWAHEIDPDFPTPERPSLTWLYRRLGFRNTSRLRSLWRGARRRIGRAP